MLNRSSLYLAPVVVITGLFGTPHVALATVVPPVTCFPPVDVDTSPEFFVFDPTDSPPWLSSNSARNEAPCVIWDDTAIESRRYADGGFHGRVAAHAVTTGAIAHMSLLRTESGTTADDTARSLTAYPVPADQPPAAWATDASTSLLPAVPGFAWTDGPTGGYAEGMSVASGGIMQAATFVFDGGLAAELTSAGAQSAHGASKPGHGRIPAGRTAPGGPVDGAADGAVAVPVTVHTPETAGFPSVIVTEPGTLALLGLGLVLIAARKTLGRLLGRKDQPANAGRAPALGR